MTLLDEIRIAQREAGEAVVMANLENIGLLKKTQDELWHDKQWVESLTKEQAAHFAKKTVEQATHFFERLEAAGKITGNGWHYSQAMGAGAAKLIDSGWVDEKGIAE